ncbi:MAG TPA: hypothetical protein VMV09_10525 [Candidatus Saccharimonadales bacterium]|nr:hypothetical protein [Candidatus Saccharimonadales bacterium]
MEIWYRESKDSGADAPRNLRERGLGQPLVFVGDGNLGPRATVEFRVYEVYRAPTRAECAPQPDALVTGPGLAAAGVRQPPRRPWPSRGPATKWRASVASDSHRWSGDARFDHDPLHHRPALAGVERAPLSADQQSLYPLARQLQHEVASADHGKDPAIDLQCVRAESTPTRTKGDPRETAQCVGENAESLLDSRYLRFGRPTPHRLRRRRRPVEALPTNAAGRQLGRSTGPMLPSHAGVQGLRLRDM